MLTSDAKAKARAAAIPIAFGVLVLLAGLYFFYTEIALS